MEGHGCRQVAEREALIGIRGAVAKVFTYSYV